MTLKPKLLLCTDINYQCLAALMDKDFTWWFGVFRWGVKYVCTIHKHFDVLQYGTCTGIECTRIEHAGISTRPSVFDSDEELCKQKEVILEQGKLVKKWKIVCIQGNFSEIIRKTAAQDCSFQKFYCFLKHGWTVAFLSSTKI